MTSTILLTAALLLPAAPVPKDAPPAGIAPRIVELKPNNEGKVTVSVRRTETVKTTVATAGGGAPRVIDRNVTKIATVELSEVKDLKVTTAGGKAVELKDALDKIKNGGLVVMTSDGKPVDAAYLRLFKDDTLVLSAPELVTTPTTAIGGTTGGGAIIRPLPAPIPGNIAPGGIQIQILPGIVEVEAPPAAPVPAPVPAPVVKPAEKK